MKEALHRHRAVKRYVEASYFPLSLGDLVHFFISEDPQHIEDAAESLVETGTLRKDYHHVRKCDVYSSADRTPILPS